MSLFPRIRSADEYPDSLQGGEGLQSPDHRVGETINQNPKIDEVDPAEDQATRDEPPPAA